MRSVPFVVGVVAGAVLLVAGPAAADPVADGGCRAFGANVATLGQDLGPAFGATASGVAQLFPQSFPTLVVFPEQRELCD